MPIRVLDAATVGRIAAGEVVERPSSVVKELVENSLDAGATSITVEIKGGGIDYLRVTDNGCGIEPNQVRIAFENHATSKLQNADQLDDIRTMGFRGEALPSIAAVSRVEMTTRTKENQTGVKFTAEGGGHMSVSEVGCPQGTTLVMRDLFFNVPVRRAFLKKASYEGGLVGDVAARLLLGNPGVSMRYISGGVTVYHSFGDGKLRNAVFAVYGRETAEMMTEVDASIGGTRIYGLIGTGELGKQTRAHQLFFINGRSVRCQLISKALEQVCRSRVTIGMYPMCVLNLVIPPTSVDVNVHPNKLEVRFRDEEMMRTTIEQLLSQAFEGERVLDLEKLRRQPEQVERTTRFTQLTPEAPKSTAEPVPENKQPADRKPQMPPIPGLDTHTEQENTPVPAAAARFETPAPALHEDHNVIDKPIRTVDIPQERTHAITEKLADPVAPVRHEPVEKPMPSEPAEKPVQLAVAEFAPKRDEFEKPEYRVIGVAFKTYILIESGDMLLMIDQHAAHERLQYERLMARIDEGTASQQLLTPIVLTVSPRELAVVTDNLDVLNEAGYSVETFGERDIRISAVPFVLGRAEVRPLFLEMLDQLSRLKSATVDVRRGEIMQAACKSAVKGGDQLTDHEIEVLIHEMLSTGAPATCPHGRPVVKTLSKRDLEKMFKRIQ